MYCVPCWKTALLWNEHLKEFKKYPNVEFLCYVHALPKDFEEINKKEKLIYPVLLDTKERVRVVNKLGHNPNKLTFLLDSTNTIILVGLPFSKEMKQKYIDIITSNR